MIEPNVHQNIHTIDGYGKLLILTQELRKGFIHLNHTRTEQYGPNTVKIYLNDKFEKGHHNRRIGTY